MNVNNHNNDNNENNPNQNDNDNNINNINDNDYESDDSDAPRVMRIPDVFDNHFPWHILHEQVEAYQAYRMRRNGQWQEHPDINYDHMTRAELETLKANCEIHLALRREPEVEPAPLVALDSGIIEDGVVDESELWDESDEDDVEITFADEHGKFTVNKSILSRQGKAYAPHEYGDLQLFLNSKRNSD